MQCLMMVNAQTAAFGEITTAIAELPFLIFLKAATDFKTCSTSRESRHDRTTPAEDPDTSRNHSRIFSIRRKQSPETVQQHDYQEKHVASKDGDETHGNWSDRTSNVPRPAQLHGQSPYPIH